MIRRGHGGGTAPLPSPPGRFGKLPSTGLAVCLLLVSAVPILAASGSKVGADGSALAALGPGHSTLAERIDAAAERALDEIRVAGFSVAVASRGEQIFAKGFGLADLQRRVQAEADTIYRTGSVGKQFTAAALVRLAEQGRLSLDDPLGKFLPDTPATLHRITVRQLLAHTAGLREVNGIPRFARTQGVGMTRAEVLDLIAQQPLEFEPGASWSYSNSGYLIAGAVIESVTGRPASDFIVADVLRPLGLLDTSDCLRPGSGQWARGYEPQDPGGWSRAARLGRPPTLRPAQPINLQIVSSAGGFCSTTIDLVRWTDQLHSGTFLSPASGREMVEPATLADGSRVPYGLGLQWRSFRDHRAIGHGGIISGFNAAVAHFPDDELTVAVMINTLLPEGEAERVWTGILAAVFDEGPGPWGELDVQGASGYGS